MSATAPAPFRRDGGSGRFGGYCLWHHYRLQGRTSSGTTFPKRAWVPVDITVVPRGSYTLLPCSQARDETVERPTVHVPEILLEADYNAMSLRAGDIVGEAIRHNPSIVLALPTGTTPIGLYADLVRRHRHEGLSLRAVTTFNLDEYVGIAIDDREGYHGFMRSHLFDHVDIPEGAWHLPNPQATDAGAEVRRYEGLIDASGGIDLAILGVGANGHLAFNEPGDTLTGPTHVAALADDTWLRNFPSLAPRLKDEPELRARYSTAYTVGIGTILRARKILVLASGMAKASILASAVRGAITPRNPASFLQLHPDVTFILDEAAGSWVHYTA